MKSVTFLSDGKEITMTSEELKELVADNYKPNGGLLDNYFFCLKFEDDENGKAIFVFSELENNYEDVVADNFVCNKKTNNLISIVFSNGSAMEGEKKGNLLKLKSDNIFYVFEKVKNK